MNLLYRCYLRASTALTTGIVTLGVKSEFATDKLDGRRQKLLLKSTMTTLDYQPALTGSPVVILLINKLQGSCNFTSFRKMYFDNLCSFFICLRSLLSRERRLHCMLLMSFVGTKDRNQLCLLEIRRTFTAGVVSSWALDGNSNIIKYGTAELCAVYLVASLVLRRGGEQLADQETESRI